MRAATEFDSRPSLDVDNLRRSEKKLLTFPMQLLEPLEFVDYLGRHARCGFALAHVFRGVSVIISELPQQAPSNAVLHSYETIATHLQRERLGDIPVWNINWFARYPSRGGLPESFFQIKFDWVPHTIPDGGFKRPRWRTLMGVEAVRLVQAFSKEIGIRGMLRDVREARKTHAFKQWSVQHR